MIDGFQIKNCPSKYLAVQNIRLKYSNTSVYNIHIIIYNFAENVGKYIKLFATFIENVSLQAIQIRNLCLNTVNESTPALQP